MNFTNLCWSVSDGCYDDALLGADMYLYPVFYRCCLPFYLIRMIIVRSAYLPRRPYFYIHFWNFEV